MKQQSIGAADQLVSGEGRYERSMRKLIRTCVWYSEIVPSATTALVPRMSIDSMPRIVFAASDRA
jgi:hypothetical protein